MLFWLIVLAVLAVLLGSTIARAFRWLARLFVSVALAILIAVPSGVLLMDQNEDEVAMALLLIVPLAAGLFWLLTPRPKVDVVSQTPLPLEKKCPRPLKCGTFRMVLSAEQISEVWDHLEEEAPHQAARIAVVRRSNEQSRAALKARPLDTHAHEAIIMLEKRIPELIHKDLAHADSLPAAARIRVIDELVDLLERFAADCERQRTEDSRLGSSETLLLRQHIERYLSRDRLRPFNPS